MSWSTWLLVFSGLIWGAYSNPSYQPGMEHEENKLNVKCCDWLSLTTADSDTVNSQGSKLGMYGKARKFLNDFPVYEHNSGSYFLYKMNNKWWVSDEAGKKGDIKATGQHGCPEDMTKWKYKDGSGFVRDKTFSATCNPGSCICGTGMAKGAYNIVENQDQSKERHLRSEEHWHPAEARDISKYQPRHAMPPMHKGEAWEKHMSNLTKAAKKIQTRDSNKMGSMYNLREICGIEGPPTKKQDRIVGGNEAASNQWPWQVALFMDNGGFCGGSLISENWVLTAAHCVDTATRIDVLAGVHDLSVLEPHRMQITSYNAIIHDKWNPWDVTNDIALIELPSPATFNDYIKPACLPAAGDTADVDELVTVTGWGRPSDSTNSIAPKLRMVSDLPVISNIDCSDVYGNVGCGVVCTDTTGGRGTCNGDSGGPANMKTEVRTAGQQWKQVALVSFGSSLGCEAGFPAAFTRVECYLNWIMDHTGISTTPPAPGPECRGEPDQRECCTTTSPCGLFGGDCDGDVHCEGSLICGSNNCKDFHPTADATTDCCITRGGCNGDPNQFDCCTACSPCGLYEGDCDSDDDCEGSLVCGVDNCKDFHPTADALADCCISQNAAELIKIIAIATDTITSTTTSMSTMPEEFEMNCPTYSNGDAPTFYPNPEDCGSYYICEADQTPVLMSCPPGLFWDTTLNTCNWPDMVDCEVP